MPTGNNLLQYQLRPTSALPSPLPVHTRVLLPATFEARAGDVDLSTGGDGDSQLVRARNRRKASETANQENFNGRGSVTYVSGAADVDCASVDVVPQAVKVDVLRIAVRCMHTGIIGQSHV